MCLLQNNLVTYDVAVKCPKPPTFQVLTPIGETNLELVKETPEYLDVAQFSCPEGHVFETYETVPDENGTYNLIQDVYSLNLTCAAYADWMPLKVPKCIRKYNKSKLSYSISDLISL